MIGAIQNRSFPSENDYIKSCHGIGNRRLCSISLKFYGPHKILSRVGPVAYKLELLEGAKIHNVFHVSLLKKWTGEVLPVLATLPTLNEDNAIIKPLAILEHRHMHGEEGILLHWLHHSPTDATWQSLFEFQLRFPSFALEGNTNSKREEILHDNQVNAILNKIWLACNFN
jgi:hypothetical protein